MQSHIHAGLRSAPTTKTYRRFYYGTLERLQNERDAAKRQYRDEIAAGNVREMTSLERLIATAYFGHEDLSATHAARRVLARRFEHVARLALGE